MSDMGGAGAGRARGGRGHFAGVHTGNQGNESGTSLVSDIYTRSIPALSRESKKDT